MKSLVKHTIDEIIKRQSLIRVKLNFVRILGFLVWQTYNTLNKQYSKNELSKAIYFRLNFKSYSSALVTLSLALLFFSSQAIAQQKVLILTTATPQIDFIEAQENAKIEFENVVGVGNVTVQSILQTPNAVGVSTFTSSPGPYDAVMVLTGYESVHASNWVAINEAISQRRAEVFYLFVDGCCKIADNATKLVQTINAASGLSVGINGSVSGNVSFPLNTDQPISASFTNLNPLKGGFTSFLGNVPVANALYLVYTATLPVLTPTTTVYGMFIPKTESYNGNGSCIFTVVDANPFVVPSWTSNKNKIAPAFLAAIDPIRGSCGKGGLRVINNLVNAPAGGAPGSYEFTVNCTNPIGTYTGTVNLGLGETSGETIVVIPEGSTNCVVTETGRPNPPSSTLWQAPTISSLASPLPLLGALVNVNNPLVKTLKVNKSLSLPTGVTGPFQFKFTATCDQPTSVSTFGPVTLSNFPSNTSVDITNVPATANCTISEQLPSAPDGWIWSTPSISDWNNITEGQSTTVSNSLNRILSISKTVTEGPTAVIGNPLQHDITYRVKVSNNTNNESSYTLTDTFGLDPDVSVVGAPTVIAGGGAGTTLANFTGSGIHTTLVSNQAIAALAEHTFDIKIRIKINQFSTSNNTCASVSGKGLFNSTTLSVGLDQQTTNACAATPDVIPVSLILRKKWNGGAPSDAVSIGATTGFAPNTTVFSSVNNGNNNSTDSATVVLTLGQEGNLPSETFIQGNPLDYTSVDWVCKNSDDTGSITTVTQGGSLSLPSESAGKTLICTLNGTEITMDTVKTANPANASVISVGDQITYSLTTTIGGGSSKEVLVLTDTLSNGLTLNSASLPSNCSVTGQIITCTYPVGTAVGSNTITYTATVNSNAVNRRPNAGVNNSVKASKGSCLSCVTTHGLVTLDTSKNVEFPAQSGAESNAASIGDTLTFTITTKVTGGATTQTLVLKDQLSLGLQLTSIPSSCTGGDTKLTCILPAGSPIGVYQFRYTAIITNDATDFVSNEVKPSIGTCKLSCTTKTKVLHQVVLRISKTANPKRVKLGDFVRYELLLENLTGPNAKNFFILDSPSPGLSYVQGSLKIEGDDNGSLTSSYPLKIDRLDLAAFKKLKVSYLMKVGAGAGRGSLCNKAWADNSKKLVTSNTATACVTRYADPDFEETHIVGVVFEDNNGNGIQDEGEAGLAGVRLITATGLVIETDSFGRYHISGIDTGTLGRGSNFIVKLLETSLKDNSVLTTQNPLVNRLTWGLPVQFNFGVKRVQSQLRPIK